MKMKKRRKERETLAMDEPAEEMMDVEPPPPAPASSAAASCGGARLALKNTILTNSGDDYVFQIASSQEISELAVSLSSNTIKFYSGETAQFLGQCSGHEGTIHEISFNSPNGAHVISSCSSDGTLRAWDIRSYQQISTLRAFGAQEIFSFSFGGSNGNLLAAGSNAQVLIWDWRSSKQLACLEESHMADVTQARFPASHHNRLLTCGVDGLMCLFDTAGDIDEDDHLLSVMNAETSIGKIGFFGDTGQKLWCLTHIETLSIWDWIEGSRKINFEDARSLASNNWNSGNVDYFVDCHYSTSDDRLWLIGGTSSGSIGYFPVSLETSGAIGAAEAILKGGHEGVVRTVYPFPGSSGSPANHRGLFAWTGGEDGRLCKWFSDGNSTGINRSWLSSTLVSRPPKHRSMLRHQPY